MRSASCSRPVRRVAELESLGRHVRVAFLSVTFKAWIRMSSAVRARFGFANSDTIGEGGSFSDSSEFMISQFQLGRPNKALQRTRRCDLGRAHVPYAGSLSLSR